MMAGRPTWWRTDRHDDFTTHFQLLANASHLVRARCLELIGELGSCDEKTKESSTADNILHLLGQYTADDDPRVRAAAFTAMVGHVTRKRWHCPLVKGLDSGLRGLGFRSLSNNLPSSPPSHHPPTHVHMHTHTHHTHMHTHTCTHTHTLTHAQNFQVK